MDFAVRSQTLLLILLLLLLLFVVVVVVVVVVVNLLHVSLNYRFQSKDDYQNMSLPFPT